MILQINEKKFDIKKEAELVCEDIGIPLATAINIFVKALAKEKRFPFPLEASSIATSDSDNVNK